MQRIGIAKLRELLPHIDSPKFDPEAFRATGVFIMRGAIPATTVEAWQAAWREFYGNGLATGRKVNRYNPVAVDEAPPPLLAGLHQHAGVLDVVEQVFGPDIALYNQRFVIKDRHSRGPVFLHQDFPYHLGWPNKASVFIPLSPVDADNGGMVFYPGTHQYGYLGDAGEIDPAILAPDWPTLTPSLLPGDLVLMNSLTWHASGAHVAGPDRVLADIIYQPADDPSGVALLRGSWRTELFLDRRTAKIFKRSRTTRLVEMQNALDALAPETHVSGRR